MKPVFFFIFGAALATYLPRALPFLLPFPEKMPRFLTSVLKVMPIAALGALIFPGVIDSFPKEPMAGILGVVGAAAVAWFRGGLILPVLTSIAAAYLYMTVM